MRSSARTGRFLIWAALCAFAPDVMRAQTAGSLSGLVVDHKGARLAGVTVAVTSASQGIGDRGAVTDAAGVFRIPALPPARDYLVRVAFPGHATVVLTGIEVSAGKIASVSITLHPEEQFREQVKVRARAQMVNLDDTTTETRFDAEFIEALPILGRNYQDVLALAPGVSDADGDGNPNIHGARDTDVVTFVDGVSVTDPYTGKIGAQLNIESIHEIEVKTSGAAAEFSRAQGGFANILTKSGGNDFQGTFKFFWRGSALDGDGAGIDDPKLHSGVGEAGVRDLRFNDYLPFLSLSGPILQDRAWYFMAHEYIHQEDPVNALNTAFVRGLREWREFAKITWQASPSSRLALSLNYDPQDFLNEGLNSFTREETGYTVRQGGTALTLKGTSVLNPSVALESSVSSFDGRPRLLPNLGPDTNRNGDLLFDWNRNGFFEASEIDPGEDYDGDGNFDVFEDTNRNRRLDAEEDRDGDGRLTLWRTGPGPFRGGCEGRLREDIDCDGRLDTVNEDLNGNGLLDGAFTFENEDKDRDGYLDLGNEDRNGNGKLDDDPFRTPFLPSDLHPYGRRDPEPGDRAYLIDRNLGITTGPYFRDFADRRRRFTFREDLSAFVPDRRGSHDLKLGLVVEREVFDRQSKARPIVSPIDLACPPDGCGTFEDEAGRQVLVDPFPTVSVILPAEREVASEAQGMTTGLYIQNQWKPVPNLTLGMGFRFDREKADTFGYSFFDPVVEAAGFERKLALRGTEGGRNGGIASDPIFTGTQQIPDLAADILDGLLLGSVGRLTRHHAAINFDSDALRSLGILPVGEVDIGELAKRGILPQQRERFTLTNNNLAPRLSVSWDPGSTGRTKLFATWGRYFDRLFLSTIAGEQGPDNVNRYYLQDPDGVSQVTGAPNRGIGQLVSKAPPSTTQVDRGLQTPFSDEFTLGFEREIAPEVSLAVTYIHRRFRHQLQDTDVNHSLRFYDFDPQGPLNEGDPLDEIGRLIFPLDPAALAPNLTAGIAIGDGRPDLYIHNVFFNQVLRVGNFNQARYQAIQLALVKRLARRWQMQASYTYSRAVGDAEDFQSRLGNDPSTVESEFGYLDYDQRHVVKVNLAMFAPRDWQIGASATWGSGLPYSIISRFFALDDLRYEQFRTRFGNTILENGVPRFVSRRRNSERNHATYDVNLQVKKSLVLGRKAAALSIEVFNLLNSDDLRIFTHEPAALTLVGVSDSTNQTARGPLQIDGQRRFGRRYQIGLQFEF